MRCGLLGEKLGHSYSPQIHSLLGTYRYDLIEKTPQEAEAFLRYGDFDALNVTIPYKKLALQCCAEVTDRASRIGSVNTIVRRADGTLFGDNTDYDGFAYMLTQSKIDVSGRKVLVLGSGGASLTVQAVLRDLGASVVVISRGGPDNYQNLSRHSDASVIVNTTPVGMYPNNGKSPINFAEFPDCIGVLDLIYNPARTKLLQDAAARGIPHAGGLTMLVAQGRRAAERFTGQSIPVTETDRIVRILQDEMENIILIGMPGSGKSTAGRALAALLHRPFYDADAELVRSAGRSIPEIFAAEGETGFRARETEILAEYGKKSGIILATGGGCVTRPENEPLLRQNGRIVWLMRDWHTLPTDGRPLSQTSNLAEMERVRRPMYKQFADISVEVSTDPAETAARIASRLMLQHDAN